RQHGETALYLHQVLEAKVLGPAGTVFSLATEFIDNRDAADTPAGASPERQKQDCELKALPRLVAKIRGAFPQLRICLVGDSEFACGPGFQVARDHRCDYLYVFKEGRTPALWRDFRGLLGLCPGQRVEVRTPEKAEQVYRWVNDLDYEDSEGRTWKFHTLHCRETTNEEEVTEWSWVTSLAVDRDTVAEVATRGGRERWRQENEGFNTQKNSGLNLEHAYSHTCWAAYYFLLQMAHLLLQLVEKGSLLGQLARQQGKRTAVELFGALKNMAQRLVGRLRYCRWGEAGFDAGVGATNQIRRKSRLGAGAAGVGGAWAGLGVGSVLLRRVQCLTRRLPSRTLSFCLAAPHRPLTDRLPRPRASRRAPISQGCIVEGVLAAGRPVGYTPPHRSPSA